MAVQKQIFKTGGSNPFDYTGMQTDVSCNLQKKKRKIHCPLFFLRSSEKEPYLEKTTEISLIKRDILHKTY